MGRLKQQLTSRDEALKKAQEEARVAKAELDKAKESVSQLRAKAQEVVVLRRDLDKEKKERQSEASQKEKELVALKQQLSSASASAAASAAQTNRTVGGTPTGTQPEGAAAPAETTAASAAPGHGGEGTASGPGTPQKPTAGLGRGLPPKPKDVKVSIMFKSLRFVSYSVPLIACFLLAFVLFLFIILRFLAIVLLLFLCLFFFSFRSVVLCFYVSFSLLLPAILKNDGRRADAGASAQHPAESRPADADAHRSLEQRSAPSARGSDEGGNGEGEVRREGEGASQEGRKPHTRLGLEGEISQCRTFAYLFLLFVCFLSLSFQK